MDNNESFKNAYVEEDFMSNFDLAKMWQPNKDMIHLKKEFQNKYNDVDFEVMLNAAAKVLKNYEETPKNINYKRSDEVFSFLNKKPKSFQNEIVKYIVQKYYKELKIKKKIPLESNHATTKKLSKNQLISVNTAFCIVSGHNFSSFLNVLKSHVYNNYGRETLKALNYLKLSNIPLKNNIDYTKCLDNDPELVEKIKKENEALFYPSFFLVGFHGLNQYQEFKGRLSSSGLTKKGWKNMCAQSRNYNLRAMRKLKVGIFCLNNNLRDAWMRNNFISEWFKHHHLAKRPHILLKEIENHIGHINKFEPFPIEMRRGMFGSNSCRQLEEVNDYLSENPDDDSKNLGVLYRRTNNWHEDIHKRRKGPLIDFKTVEIEKFESNDYLFEQIKDSHTLYDEGDTMHHCVSTYKNQCKEEIYVVFKVENNKTEERATLGISIKKATENSKNKKTTYIFNQIRGYCNKSVSNEMHNAGLILIKELNKEAAKKVVSSTEVKEVEYEIVQ